MREKAIEARLIRNVKRLNCLVVKNLATETGWPDRNIVLPTGLTAYVELKTNKGVLSPRQRLIGAQIKAQGAPYFIVFDRVSEQLFLNWIKKQIELYATGI